MPSVERRITIEAPVDKVFAYIADFSRHPEWARNRLRLAGLGGPAHVGWTFRSAAGMWGGERRDEVTVVELVPDRKVVFDATGDFGSWRHELAVEGDGEGARLRKSQEALGPPARAPVALWAFARLPEGIRALVVGKILEGDLRRIKARVEAEAGRAGAADSRRSMGGRLQVS